MKETKAEKIEVILHDFTHDISVKDLSLLSRVDIYGNLKKYFKEVGRINELGKKALPQIFNAIINNRISNIEVIINNLGYDIIQPDCRLIVRGISKQHDDDIALINKQANEAFNKILEVLK